MDKNTTQKSGEVSHHSRIRSFFGRLFRSKHDKNDTTDNKDKQKQKSHKNKETKNQVVEQKEVEEPIMCAVAGKTQSQPKREIMEKTIKFAVGVNVEMWRRIIDNSLIGTKLIDNAAICTLNTGEIIVCNPKDYTPSVEQMRSVYNGFEEPSAIKVNGFEIVNQWFRLVDNDESQIIGKCEGSPGGVALLKTKTVIIIGQWSQRGLDPLNLLHDIKTFVQNQGL